MERCWYENLAGLELSNSDGIDYEANPIEARFRKHLRPMKGTEKKKGLKVLSS